MLQRWSRYEAEEDDLSSGPTALYVADHSPTQVRCRGCGDYVRRLAVRVVFQRLGQRQLCYAHPGCMSQVPGLARPRLGRGADDVHFSPQLDEEERVAVEVQLQGLAPAPRTSDGSIGGLQRFAWPPRPRGVTAAAMAARLRSIAAGGSGGSGQQEQLRRRLLSRHGDFRPEDYEMLLQLDAANAEARAPQRRRDTGHLEALLSAMPVSLLPPSAAAEGEQAATRQCSICLDDMKPGAEVRTLPCMHVFHRACIDKWLSMAPPGHLRCPIDQIDIDLSATRRA